MKNDLKELALATSHRSRLAGITQEQIANALNVSQSQISRILSGGSKRRTKLFNDVCIYVNNMAHGVSPDLVRGNDELIDAIADIWDGTSHQAKAIASVIRSLGPLSHHREPRKSLSGVARKESDA